MSATQYDANTTPNATSWLSLDERERIRLALNFHVAQRLKAPNLKAHAVFHVVIENQVASGCGPTVRAMARLQEQGLSRHESIHAVAAIVGEHLRLQAKGQGPQDPAQSQSTLNTAIEALTAELWCRQFG